MLSPKNYKLEQGTNNTPVNLDEAKEYLRVTDSSEDKAITNMIKAATRYFESVTGRELINKTYKAFLDCFPGSNDIYIDTGYIMAYNTKNNGILLKKSKLQSVTLIEYYIDGTLTAWDSPNYYITDEEDFGGIFLVEGKKWPTDVDKRKQAIEITFVAGYGSSDCDVPADIKQGLLQYISYLYENRGDCDCGSGFPASAEQSFMNNKIIDL